MKRTKFMTVLAALICAMPCWAADYNVGTDGELRSAIQNDNANITVTADIDLSNSTLSIAAGKTVTINLGGHTLDHRLTQRGESGGQVITVRSGARLCQQLPQQRHHHEHR
jgi:type 1 fimbria pilin